MSFSENLKNIRRQKGLTQKELATQLGVAQSTVGMWETDQRTPKLYELKRIALTLNITINRLISGAERKIEIVKNEIYIDGQKLEELNPLDIESIIKHIDELRSGKVSKTHISEQTPGKKLQQVKKVLIIDDEQEMCELLYSYLVGHNYKVFLSFNGQMGLEYFDEIKPDVVLLDLHLPDIKGIEVLRIIRKISNVPVIVITAHPEDVADIHLKDLNIDGFIEKPISLQQVLNTLKHIIGE